MPARAPVLLNLITRTSFRSQVLHTFHKAGVRPHPILYRPVSHQGTTRNRSTANPGSLKLKPAGEATKVTHGAAPQHPSVDA